jgi:copper resistance protein B
MNRLLLALIAASVAGSALAQTPDPHAGHRMPAPPPAADPHAGHKMPMAQPAPAADPHAAHRAPAADPHAGHVMPAAPSTGADLPVGNEPAPTPPTEPAADAVWGAANMERARGVLRLEHGGGQASQVMLNLAEASLGGRGYQWEGEAWLGGDEHRFVLKSEGEGARGHGVENAEIQALYSRPVGVYTDLQVGVRHDFEPGPSRTYATLGFETLAPYWFEIEGALFLSERGHLSARLEGSTDYRLTQRLVLQPRAELNFAAEDDVRRGIGSGLSDAEVGLRLRYELRREFAPYVGVVWSRKIGDTADFARVGGEDVEDVRAVAGLRAWF